MNIVFCGNQAIRHLVVTWAQRDTPPCLPVVGTALHTLFSRKETLPFSGCTTCLPVVGTALRILFSRKETLLFSGCTTDNNSTTDVEVRTAKSNLQVKRKRKFDNAAVDILISFHSEFINSSPFSVFISPSQSAKRTCNL